MWLIQLNYFWLLSLLLANQTHVKAMYTTFELKNGHLQVESLVYQHLFRNYFYDTNDVAVAAAVEWMVGAVALWCVWGCSL